MMWMRNVPQGAAVLMATALVLAGCEQGASITTPGRQAGTAFEYPAAERENHVDIYHGASVNDPYRWMEDVDSEATASWVEAQNGLAQPYLEKIAAREAIKARMTALWNYERIGVPFKVAGRYFYERNDGLQDQDVLYVTDSLDKAPRVLIDPNAMSGDATVALSWYKVSPDGSRIAYCVSDGGSDWKIWSVRDVETGEDLADRLEGTKFTRAAWSPDSSGFYYSRYPGKEDGEYDDGQQVSVYYHQLGKPQSEDKLVYEVTDHDTRNPSAYVTDDGRYLIVYQTDGFESNAVYYRRLDDDTQVKPIFDQWDARYSFIGNLGPRMFFLTNRDAPQGRVVAVQPEDMGNEFVELIPESADRLEDVSLLSGRLIAEYLKDARSVVRVFDSEGVLEQTLDLPGIGSVGGFSGAQDESETFFRYTDYTMPSTIYHYTVDEGGFELYKKPEVDITPEDFVTRQVFFESKDGARVPMFLIHRKGLDPDRPHPTLLYGYGGFDISMTPGYSTTRMVWLEMGGVYAVVNLRGGGEYGSEWHRAGTKLEKQNVFDDFIAAAGYLIDEGITSSKHLAIIGRSNGGLLVGATMTQRPDLFAAALPGVGVLDMLRYHTASANARAWSSDYGLSENQDEFDALLAYSPYHNVREGTCYPPTLVTTADHDDRVVPWHSFKFGAALQEAQGCENPIIVRVETRAGHGAGKPTWMVIDDYADQWAFLAEHLDMEVKLK